MSQLLRSASCATEVSVTRGFANNPECWAFCAVNRAYDGGCGNVLQLSEYAEQVSRGLLTRLE